MAKTAAQKAAANAKGVNGSTGTAPNVLGDKRSSDSATPKATKHAASAARVAAGRQVALAKRRKSAAVKTADTGFEAAGTVVANETFDECVAWLIAHPNLVDHTATLMRNGHIQLSYDSKLNMNAAKNVDNQLGRRIAPEGSKQMARSFADHVQVIGVRSSGRLVRQHCKLVVWR